MEPQDRQGDNFQEAPEKQQQIPGNVTPQLVSDTFMFGELDEIVRKSQHAEYFFL